MFTGLLLTANLIKRNQLIAVTQPTIINSVLSKGPFKNMNMHSNGEGLQMSLSFANKKRMKKGEGVRDTGTCHGKCKSRNLLSVINGMENDVIDVTESI